MFRYKNDHKHNQSLDYTNVQEEHLEYFVFDSDETPIGWSAIRLDHREDHALSRHRSAGCGSPNGLDWALDDVEPAGNPGPGH